MLNPRCVRIFFNKTDAEYAKHILEKAHITAKITEDKFGTLRLPDLGMLPRYRLYIDELDINRAGQYLANKLQGIESIEGKIED